MWTWVSESLERTRLYLLQATRSNKRIGGGIRELFSLKYVYFVLVYCVTGLYFLFCLLYIAHGSYAADESNRKRKVFRFVNVLSSWHDIMCI